MGQRAWICFRYKGMYYALHHQWGMIETVGECLVALLRDHPDPAVWKQLMDKASFVLISEHLEPPSDEIIEAARQYVLSDEKNKECWVRDMCMEENNVVYLDEEIEHLIPQTRETLEDPSKFRDFIRNEAEKKMGNKNNSGWNWLCRDIEWHQRLHYRLLELGAFVFNDGPKPRPFELDLFMEYVYVIDMDNGKFSVDSCYIAESREFKVGNIPYKWLNTLMLPLEWVELAYAFTPTVHKLVKSKLEQNGILWYLVLDNLGFDQAMEFVGHVQEFLFGQHHKREDAKKLEKKQCNLLALQMVLDVYSIPTPFSSCLAVDPLPGGTSNWRRGADGCFTLVEEDENFF